MTDDENSIALEDDRPTLGTLRRHPVRHVLVPAFVALGIVLAVAGLISLVDTRLVATREPATLTTSQDPDGLPFCDGTETHYAVKGTDCRLLPIVTAPGALGPPNTGGSIDGIDWVPAYPGSNVWIPEHQISGRLYVKSPGSRVPVPPGYVEIGRTPTGSVLYWRTDPIESPSPVPVNRE